MPKPKLERHHLSSIFPEMRDEDYANLRRSIRKSGFNGSKQIVLLDGMVLDGWNRLRAALEEGISEIDIPKRLFKGGDPIDFVMQENLARRHMTAAQASAAAVKLIDAWKTAEAAEKELEKQKADKAKKKGEKPAPKTPRAKGEKTAKAAKLLGVSPRSVAAAAKVKKHNPAAFAEIEKGKKSVNQAAKETDKQLSAEQRATKQFEEACARVDKICGDGFSKVVAKKLNTKEIIKLSNLDKEEMLRVKPLVEGGWKLQQALSYKAVNLSHAHNIRQLLDRATANGGVFTLEIDDYVIEVKKAK